MKHPTTSKFSRSSLSYFGAAAIGALVLGAGAIISSAPAAAATGSTYCLTSDAQSDCGFVSLAQCEASAAGGLGSCDAAAGWSDDRSAFTRMRGQARPGLLPRR